MGATEQDDQTTFGGGGAYTAYQIGSGEQTPVGGLGDVVGDQTFKARLGVKQVIGEKSRKNESIPSAKPFRIGRSRFIPRLREAR